MFILTVACGISIVVIGLLFVMAAGLDMPHSRRDRDLGYQQTELKACTVIDLDDRQPQITHPSIRYPG